MAKRFFLVAGEKVCYSNIVILGFKGQKAIHACMMRLLNLEPAKHGEEQIPNVCGIAGSLLRAIRNVIFVDISWEQWKIFLGISREGSLVCHLARPGNTRMLYEKER